MAIDLNKVKTMINLTDSGQDSFVENWAEFAELQLYEMGISNTFIDGTQSTYVIAKLITDLIEDGSVSSTTMELIKTLRANHPHSEDEVDV